VSQFQRPGKACNQTDWRHPFSQQLPIGHCCNVDFSYLVLYADWEDRSSRRKSFSLRPSNKIYLLSLSLFVNSIMNFEPSNPPDFIRYNTETIYEAVIYEWNSTFMYSMVVWPSLFPRRKCYILSKQVLKW